MEVRKSDRNLATQAASPRGAVAAPADDSERIRSAGGTYGPTRYFIYLFDDVNIRFADMANMRAAAVSHFKSNFATGDRASIYTVSASPSMADANTAAQTSSE